MDNGNVDATMRHAYLHLHLAAGIDTTGNVISVQGFGLCVIITERLFDGENRMQTSNVSFF